MNTASSSMTRRLFLAGAAAAATIPLLPGCSGSSAARRGARVIVIGAGISGLAAARSLVDSGFRVLILEARDRIAGRIHSDDSLGSALDLGASWIHGSRGNPLTALARRHNVATFASDLDDRASYDIDGRELSDELLDPWDDLLERAEILARRAPRDLSVADAVRQVLAGRRLSPLESRIVENTLTGAECESGGSADRLSMRALEADEAFAGPDLLFPNGYAALPEILARGIDIHLSEPVRAVTRSDSGVLVETDKERHEAEAVVVTLPVGIYKRGGITFHPTLPEAKLGAIQRLGTGVLNKVAVRFPEAFWPEDTEYFDYLGDTRRDGAIANATCAGCHAPPNQRESGGFAEFVNMVPVNGSPILVSLSGGPFAHRLESWTDERIREEIMTTFRRMFGESLPDPTGMIVSRWHQDPWAGGAYPHVPVGASLNDFKILAQPVGDRVFFAGDGTNELYPSTVHGAYLSGQRAAREIRSALG